MSMSQSVTIFFDFDCCPSELSWEIRDSNGEIVAQKHYDSDLPIPPYGHAQERIELKDDVEYALTVMDEAGDGFEEESDGMYQVFRASREPSEGGWKDRISIAQIQGNFGQSMTHALTSLNSNSSSVLIQSPPLGEGVVGINTPFGEPNSNLVGLVSLAIFLCSLFSIIVIRQKLKNRRKGKGVVMKKESSEDRRGSGSITTNHLDCILLQQHQHEDLARRRRVLQGSDIPVFVEVQLCS